MGEYMTQLKKYAMRFIPGSIDDVGTQREMLMKFLRKIKYKRAKANTRNCLKSDLKLQRKFTIEFEKIENKISNDKLEFMKGVSL